ncbi:MAG: hypothetical protein ACXVQR_02655 [Solirubrobacteraceae bacterium]
MKRLLLPFAALLGLAALVPGAASAKTVELGATSTPLQAPSCPSGVPKSQCTIILTETTALETASDNVTYPTTVKTAGRIVGYTLGLAKLAKADITTLDALYGGAPQAQLAVLRRPKGTKSTQRLYTLVATSKPNFIQPWLGQVTTWPLTASLPVKPGDVVALTVPTWAPVLAINLPAKPFQYRASRATGCALQSTFSTQTSQLTIGSTKPYLCFYTATRVEYTATEITSPPIPKGAVK